MCMCAFMCEGAWVCVRERMCMHMKYRDEVRKIT